MCACVHVCAGARACACVRAVCMDVPVPGIRTSGVRAGVRVRAVCVCMCASVDARNYRSGLPLGIILYTTWTRARVQHRARDCTTCARKCLLPTQCQPQSSPRFSARERRISVTRSPSPLFFSRPRQMAEAQCKIKPTTLVGFFLFASDPCGKLASGGSDPSGELASGGSDPSGELASGGLCFELDFALQPRNSEYHLPRFILLSQLHRLNTKTFISNRSRGTSYH